MDESSPKTLFLESVQRCSASDEFIPAFYRRFLDSSDEVKIKFASTNFEKQNAMLLHSLQLCAGAANSETKSLREINERAITHDRDHLNIRPGLYVFWLDSLIETAREYDDQWDESIEMAWRRILGHVIHHMTRKY